MIVPSLFVLFGTSIIESVSTSEEVFVCPPLSVLPVYAVNKTFQCSRLQCSTYAGYHQSVGFAYQEGICTLIGVGLSVSSETKEKMCVKLPSPEMLEEVARFKTTYASPPYNIQVKDNAVDGSLSTFYMSASYLLHPWWLVDLGAVRKIYKITVLPVKSLSYRFHHIKIRASNILTTNGDFSAWNLLAYYNKLYDLDQGLLTLYVNGTDARYISFQRATDEIGDDNLQMIEVEVIARMN